MSNCRQSNACLTFGEMKVTEIMSRPVITVTPDTATEAAAELFIKHDISALPVIGSKGDLVGIVSEADLLGIAPRRAAGDAPQTVANVMTRPVLSVPAGCEVSQVARILLECGYRHVPVVIDRKVVGIVSRRDLVRVIARRDDMIKGEIARELGELGLGTSLGEVSVDVGVVTIQFDEGPDRRLAESVILSVPGVFRVRFTDLSGR